jgi:sterol desaturase/sphingolipid hydroxylase (fatty acid hydroxylase superfamily)
MFCACASADLTVTYVNFPFTKKEMEQMEIMQRKLLRQLQGLSNQVANTAVYVLSGAVPIYMMIERNMLSLLMNIIRNKMFCACASADLTVTYVNFPFTTGIIAYEV